MEWHLAEEPTIACLEAWATSSCHRRTMPTSATAKIRFFSVPIRRGHPADQRRLRGRCPSGLCGSHLGVRNETWLSILRGNFSRIVQGEATRRTLRVIDFRDPDNNVLTVTHQFRVKAEKTRIPDVVIHLNGIPVVVIECKSPINYKDKTGEAFEQIKQYEREIPRLFLSNCFNIVTDGTNCLYGSTGSPSEFFAAWRDPWPRQETDFPNELSKGLWSLLEPSRLLDLIAHFIVFEKTEPVPSRRCAATSSSERSTRSSSG